tara:strand:+ start:853 stop:2079 length:1227 start_codon:yes stop_codon:yes gene_type:complete
MEIKLDDIRWSILKHPAQHKVLCTGRRWGKSVLSAVFLLHQPFAPGERRAYISPYYRQSKLIMFPLMKELMLSFGEVKINETELSFRFANGAELALKGADNPDSLRGISLGHNGSNGVVIDEMAYCKQGFFEEIVMPMLMDHSSKAMLCSTPSGYNHFYNYYLAGQPGGKPNWKSWQFKTIEHGMIPKKAVLEAKKSMTKDQYLQELEGDFLTTGNKAVWNFDRNIHVKEIVDMPPTLFFGQDFNVSMMATILMGVYTDGTVVAIDELALTNSNTEEMAREMKKKWPNVTTTFPDPAGRALSTTSNNRSDHAILREFGFNVRAKSKAPLQKDRLYSLNRLLMNSEGQIKMTVSPKCVNLIRDYELTQRDKHGNLDKSDLSLSHFLDASSYYSDLVHPAYRRTATSLEF